MNALISELKKENEDFEFYPTTDEIIFALIKNIKNLEYSKSGYYSKRFDFNSFLDIGAGNGKVLKAINKEYHIKQYAIEKADCLRDLLEQDVYIIGTNFEEQSLIDKEIDVTFCNPPYSQFIKWSEKIIRESCSSFIYLVIPKRWENSEDINEALKYRNAEYKVIGEYSFIDSEDRKARAIVNLIKIELSKEFNDSFQRFFDTEFKDLKEKFDTDKEEKSADEQEKEEKDTKFGSLVLGETYVKSIVNMYNEDIKNIKCNYQAVGKLDAKLLKEFKICPDTILNYLKERLVNLKKLYWNELISRMTEITDRLTNKYRTELLNTLNANGHVDFTEGNIYAVVLWIISNAGKYIDIQLMGVYEEMITRANCKNYKSNKKVYEEDRWRYNQEEKTHIYLDYRLVITRWGGMEIDWYGKKCYNSLTETACKNLTDLLTVANNLGFKCSTGDYRLTLYDRYSDKGWRPGKPLEFSCIYKGENIVLFECKAHKNGNLHIRLNQKFALALNVEMGRLSGWIHSGKEAANEMSEPKAAQYFKTNFSLLKSPFLAIEQKIEPETIPEIKPIIKKDSPSLNNFKGEQTDLLKNLREAFHAQN